MKSFFTDAFPRFVVREYLIFGLWRQLIGAVQIQKTCPFAP